MNTTPYETVKCFELQTGFQTKLVVEVSARANAGRRSYRVGSFRVYRNGDGEEKRSPYLGKRELALKPGLEKAAMEFIDAQEVAAPAAA